MEPIYRAIDEILAEHANQTPVSHDSKADVLYSCPMTPSKEGGIELPPPEEALSMLARDMRVADNLSLAPGFKPKDVKHRSFRRKNHPWPMTIAQTLEHGHRRLTNRETEVHNVGSEASSDQILAALQGQLAVKKEDIRGQNDLCVDRERSIFTETCTFVLALEKIPRKRTEAANPRTWPTLVLPIGRLVIESLDGASCVLTDYIVVANAADAKLPLWLVFRPFVPDNAMLREQMGSQDEGTRGTEGTGHDRRLAFYTRVSDPGILDFHSRVLSQRNGDECVHIISLGLGIGHLGDISSVALRANLVIGQPRFGPVEEPPVLKFTGTLAIEAAAQMLHESSQTSGPPL